MHNSGGLIYELKMNEVNGRFTTLDVQGTLLYCGTEKGPIIVFDLIKGHFVK